MRAGEGRAALERAGRRLGRSPDGRKGPAALVFVTDPRRTPDPVGVAMGLPRGAAVIHRAFGEREAEAIAGQLAAVARRRGLVLLIGADEGLAVRVRAHGLHLPERMLPELPRLRQRHPRWILTAAAHSPRALRRAEQAGADAVLLSSAFRSRSASRHTVWGAVRFARLAKSSRTPVIALGGVDGANAARLIGAGAAGLAALGAWLA